MISLLFIFFVGRPRMYQYDSLKKTRDVYRLNVLLKVISDALSKLREIEMKKYGITPEQNKALTSIYYLGEEATPSRISRWVFREPHTVLVLINRMQKMGLVKKEAYPKNKHLIRVSLTEKGYEIFESAIKYRSYIKVYNALTKRQRLQLFSILQVLKNSVFENLALDEKSRSELEASIMLPFSELLPENGTAKNLNNLVKGISEQTFYRGKKLYGELGPDELRRIKQLEEENQSLKQIVADLLDKHIL